MSKYKIFLSSITLDNKKPGVISVADHGDFVIITMDNGNQIRGTITGFQRENDMVILDHHFGVNISKIVKIYKRSYEEETKTLWGKILHKLNNLLKN